MMITQNNIPLYNSSNVENITNNLLHIYAINHDIDKICYELREDKDHSHRLNIINNNQTILDILLKYHNPNKDALDLMELIRLLGGKTYEELSVECVNALIHHNNEMTELEALEWIEEKIDNICLIDDLKTRKKTLLQSSVSYDAIKKIKASDNKPIFYEENYSIGIICYVGSDGFYKINSIYLDIIIGKGQFGTIYVTHDLYDDNYGVSDIVKVIKITGQPPDMIENEMNIHTDIGYHCVMTDEYYYIFMKYGGVPLSCLPINIPVSLKKKIGLSLLEEFHNIHYNHILHRDVKPDNVLVLIYTDHTREIDGTTNVVISAKVTICDYGNACYMRDTDYDFVGSPAYLPHEFHSSNRSPYSIQTESYSIGILLGNLFSRNDFDKYQSTKDRHDDYLPSDIQKAYPDLFLNDDNFNRLKVSDPCLYTFIKFIHFLCNENKNQRPIFKHYVVIIKKLDTFINFNKNTNSDSFKDTITGRDKFKNSISGFIGVFSGSHDNVDIPPIISPRQYSPRQYSPRQYSPRQHSPRQYSPRKSTIIVHPLKKSGNSLKKAASNGGFSRKTENLRTIMAERRTKSESSAEHILTDNAKIKHPLHNTERNINNDKNNGNPEK